MPTTYGNYVVRPMQSFGAPEPTQVRHLAEMMVLKPEMMREVMVRMFTATVRPTFASLLKEHAAVREFDNNREYTWMIAGTAYKNIPLIEARDENGAVVANSTATYGKAGAHIFLLFPEKYFFREEIIVGSYNEYYQFRIIADPIAEGPNYLYECELVSGAAEGIQGAYLQEGERFSMEFTLAEDELTTTSGGIRENTPSEMRNEFTTMVKAKKFEGRADQNQKMCCSLPIMRRDQVTGAVTTQNVDNWFTNEEWIFFKEWEEECERVLMYSRSNRNSNGNYFNIGRSGNVIKEGNGLFAQMEYGNRHEYNAFNEDFDLNGLEDALYDVCEKGNVPMNERTFVITTGNRGMIQAHKAILKETNGWRDMTNDHSSTNVIQGTSSNVHQNSLAFGAQFTELRSPNGLVLKFVYEPAYDDTVRNKILGPDGKGVLNSYRYDIWDMGSSSEPNMLICKVKGYDNTAKYILGLHNPFGIKSNIISVNESSASIHVSDMIGACILDPTRCLTYAPSGLVG